MCFNGHAQDRAIPDVIGERNHPLTRSYSDSFSHTISRLSQHAAVRAMKGLPVDWRDLCDFAWQEKLKCHEIETRVALSI